MQVLRTRQATILRFDNERPVNPTLMNNSGSCKYHGRTGDTGRKETLMNEDAAAIAVLPNQPSVWELTFSFLTRLINKILKPRAETIFPSPSQDAFEKAHKMIRLAENYGDAYEDIVNRIRQESARYKAFKKNPEPIGKVTLNVKRLGS